MKKLMLWLAMLVFVMPVSAAPKEDMQYETLGNPQPTQAADKIEVVELFWYGCPHCFQLEPVVAKWLETKPADVDFIRIPAVLGPSWELLARGYYTAELLGVLDKIHNPLFEYIHVQRKRITSVGQLKDFFKKAGISEKDFEATFGSFAVITKTNRAKQAHIRYGISGVPAVIVNGKYRTTANLAGGNQKLITVVDELIQQERSNKAATASK